MNRKIKTPPVDYVYVRRDTDGYLLNGIAPGQSKARALIIHWMPPGRYDLARRFTSAGNAVKCIKDYGVIGASVIDRAGRVLRKIDEED